MDTSIVNDAVKTILGEHVLPQDREFNIGKGILDFSCLRGLSTRPFIEFVEREYRESPFVFEENASALSKTWSGFSAQTPVYAIVRLEDDAGENKVPFFQRYNSGVSETQVHAHQCRTYLAIYESGNADNMFRPQVFIFDLMYHIESPHKGLRELSVLMPYATQLNRLITPVVWKAIDDAIETRYKERSKALAKEVEELSKGWSTYGRKAASITADLRLLAQTQG
jgi:hypothetical protein